MKNLIVDSFKNLLILMSIGMFLISCTPDDQKFTNWIMENQGKEFTPELMDELVSEFGEPIDTIRGEDAELMVYSTYLFYGPYFTLELGDSLHKQERKEYDELFSKYTSLCQESNSSLDSNCPVWQEFMTTLDAHDAKYISIYENGSGEKTTTLGAFLTAYKSKFPGLAEDEYLKRLRTSYFKGITDVQIDEIKTTRYQFIGQSSVSYASIHDEEQSEYSPRDFKVDIFKEIIVLGDGTISSELPLGTEYCITDDSKKELEDHMIGTWRFESGGTNASFTFNSDGTYQYASSLFNINEEGKWWINCTGELENSKGNIHVITNKGILAGETLYTK
jgi:hypothetical protein